jgi:glutaconate CoA-transferase subunit A
MNDLKAPFIRDDKVMTIREAVKRYVNSGDTVYVGGFQTGIPTEACFEIARQKKKDLTCWTTGHDTCLGIDLLVGTGCCKEVHYSWLASWPARRAPATQRALAESKVKLYAYSNYSALAALMGAFMGVPYMPIVSEIGSDLMKYNPNLLSTTCPFTGKKLAAVKSPKIDTALIAVQRADSSGNGQKWMGRGPSDEWGAGAADRVILVAEEVVSTDVIRHDPDRTFVPSFKSCAVVHCPWGCHPTGMHGHYIRDMVFERYAAKHVSDVSKYQKFLDEWVYAFEDRSQYVKHYEKKFGHEALERQRISNHIYPLAQVDYGYTRYEVYKDLEYAVE